MGDKIQWKLSLRAILFVECELEARSLVKFRALFRCSRKISPLFVVEKLNPCIEELLSNQRLYNFSVLLYLTSWLFHFYLIRHKTEMVWLIARKNEKKPPRNALQTHNNAQLRSQENDNAGRYLRRNHSVLFMLPNCLNDLWTENTQKVFEYCKSSVIWEKEKYVIFFLSFKRKTGTCQEFGVSHSSWNETVVTGCQSGFKRLKTVFPQCFHYPTVQRSLIPFS